jgi:Ca-activated chloride channel family protein
MRFEHPYLFIILIVPFILFVILVLTNKEGVERVFPKEVFDKIKVAGSGMSNRGRNSLIFISIFFMIIAISHPYVYKGNIDVEVKAKKIVVALDASASMRSKDRPPNRFEFAKRKVKELFRLLPQDEIMLLLFGDSVFLVSPFTNDKDTLIDVINGIDSEYILRSNDFTALAEVLRDDLKDKELKIAVVVTDGDIEKDALEDFEKIILNEGIKLFVILVGTERGAVVLDDTGKPIRISGKFIKSRMRKYIGEIAKKSGGDYIIATSSIQGVKSIADKIKSFKIPERASNQIINVKNRIELFYYPMILSLIILISALFSLPTNLRSEKGSGES